MLADEPPGGASGHLTPTLHRPSAWLETIVDFIYARLAEWRDDPFRPHETAETRLTAQLCQFLNGATRAAGLDSVVFHAEVPDPTVPGRTLDLAPGPCGCVIWIDGRRHSLYDPILPIECKRLPTPRGADRERREYLHTQKRTTGGVQRFKAGLHGAGHSTGVMIGYVQEGSLPDWFQRINWWVRVLVRAGVLGWSAGDSLRRKAHDRTHRIAKHGSVNARMGSGPIAMHHLWIDMQPAAVEAASSNNS